MITSTELWVGLGLTVSTLVFLVLMALGDDEMED